MNIQNCPHCHIRVVLVLYLLAIWASLALTVKRWHDRDKSGWWTLIYFIPLIGPLWLSLELGFLPGTKGANRFGPAPSRHQHELQQSVV